MVPGTCRATGAVKSRAASPAPPDLNSPSHHESGVAAANRPGNLRPGLAGTGSRGRGLLGNGPAGRGPHCLWLRVRARGCRSLRAPICVSMACPSIESDP